ncbi:unnamed protein product, partial [Scytosiphon promiscuus]
QDFLEDDPGLANAVDVSEFGTGYRPLHYAAYGGFLPVCEALHAAGARALAAGDNGVTALFLAAQAGKADVVRFLLDLGADPTTPERESGLCAADVAVGESGPDILQQMQEKCDLSVPPPLEAPPTVTRVESTSLQAAFLPLRFETGSRVPRLPVARYKVKVEREGDKGHGDQNRVVCGTASGTDISSTGDIRSGGGNTVAVAERGAAAVSSPDAARANSGDTFASPTLAVIVLVPAQTPAAEDARPQQRMVVRVGGLEPAMRYRVKVAAINALGYGPYGPASSVVVTPEKTEEGVFDGSAETRKKTAALPQAEEDARVKRGKGRQMLAMERRRRMAAEAALLQEQQQREAEENHRRDRRARREEIRGQRSVGRVSVRQLSAAPECSNGRHGDREGEKGAGASGGRDDLTESTDHPHLPDRRRFDPRSRRRHQVSNTTSSARSTERGGSQFPSTADSGTSTSGKSQQRTAPTPTPAAPAAAIRRGSPSHPPKNKGHRGNEKDARPATAEASSGGRGHAEEDGDGGVGDELTPATSTSRRLVATAPASGTAAEPRYLAATMAGRMSARAYRNLNDELASHDSTGGRSGSSKSSNAHGRKRLLRGSSPLLVANNASKGALTATVQAGGRRDFHSQSDVSVSSCGDMTISSEEDEGHELAYTG